MDYLTKSGGVSSEWEGYLRDESLLLESSDKKIEHKAIPQIFMHGECINPPRDNDFELITPAELTETGYTWHNWFYDWCKTLICSIPSRKYDIIDLDNINIENRP